MLTDLTHADWITLLDVLGSRYVTVKHIAPSLAKMVRVQKTKNSEDPEDSPHNHHVRQPCFERSCQILM